MLFLKHYNFLIYNKIKMLQRKNIIKAILTAIVVLATTLSSFATDYYWKTTGKASQVFTDIGNWETAPGSGIVPAGGLAPGSSDNVFFPAGNLVQSITIPTSGATCRNLTILAGGLITFTGNNGTLTIHGNLVANGNIMLNQSNTVFMGSQSDHIINFGNSNPHSSFSNTTTFSGSGVYTLNSNFNLGAGRITFINNSFVANGYATTAGDLYIENNVSGTKSINFSNSKITVTSGRQEFGRAGALAFRAPIASTSYVFNNAEIVLDQQSSLCAILVTQSGIVIDNLKSLTFQENGTTSVPIDIDNSQIFTINAQELNLNVSDFKIVSGNTVNFSTKTINFLKPVNYNITGTANLKVDKINEISSCEGQSVLLSLGIQNVNFESTSPIIITNTAFKTTTFSGQTLSMPLENDLGQNTGTYITTAVTPSKSFYWVGRSGNWNDPTNWSTIGSGGIPQTAAGCLPTLTDDVIFDANSFNAAGQSVTIAGNNNTIANVRNILWTDPNKRGKLTGGLININGNSDFSGSIGVASTLYFMGKQNNHTVKSGSSFTYTSPSVNFIGTGTYTLVDNFIANEDSSRGTEFNVYSGTFISAGHTITAFAFDSRSLPTNDGSIRNIDITGSTLNFSSTSNSKIAFQLLTSRLHSFTAVSSTINISGVDPALTITGTNGPEENLKVIALNNVNFTDPNGSPRFVNSVLNFSANIVSFSSNATVTSNNTTIGSVHSVNTYNLTPAKVYLFTPSTNVTYKVVNGINSNSNGVCSPKVSISSATAGTAFKISKASAPFTINNAIVKDINSTGATLNIIGGQDLLNNTNVVVTPPTSKTFYWVGGTGNWNDASHWSIGTSGGNPAVNNIDNCIPSIADDVFFDGNSFTSNGQAVTISGSAFVRNITWENTVNNFSPSLAGGNTDILNVFGSLRFSSGMTNTFSGLIDMRGNSITQNSNSITTNGVLIASSLYFSGGGRYDIIDNILINKITELFSGQLFTNGKNLTSNQIRLNLAGTNKADLTNSIVEAKQYLNGFNFNIVNIASTNNFITTGSTLVSTSADANLYISSPIAVSVNKVVLGTTGARSNASISALNSTVNELTFLSPTNTISQSIVINNLTVPTASSNKMPANQTVTITNQINANGTPCNLTEFFSSIPGTLATISSTNCNLDLKFVRLTNIKAGTCTISQNKVIGDNVLNSNTNFTFFNIDNVEYLGGDITLNCNQFPYTLNTTGFGTNAVSYVWGDGSTGSTLIVNGPGKYKVLVNYGNNCSLSDEIEIKLATSVILNMPTLDKCGNSSNEGTFNLTDANALLVANPANYTFTYYATAADASAATNPINNTYLSTTKTVFVRAVEIAGGCFSTGEVKLNVIAIDVPSALATQKICAAGTYTISNIAITGTNIKWYANLASITEIPNTTVLVSGTTYYATQTLAGGCESARIPIKIILENCALTNPALRFRGN
jgi:hypothetical protein